MRACLRLWKPVRYSVRASLSNVISSTLCTVLRFLGGGTRPSFLGLGAAKNAGSLSIMTLSLSGKFVWLQCVVWREQEVEVRTGRMFGCKRESRSTVNLLIAPPCSKVHSMQETALSDSAPSYRPSLMLASSRQQPAGRTPSIQSHATDARHSLSAVTSTLPGSGSWSYTTLPVVHYTIPSHLQHNNQRRRQRHRRELCTTYQP